MDKLVEITKNSFKKELIGLSPKVSELSEIVWFVFKMGGSAPTNVVASRFQDFKTDLDNLTQMGIFRVIENLVIFTEDFEDKLIKKSINEISVTDIYNTLLNHYSTNLTKMYKLDDFIDPIAAVLTVVINATTPEQPVFLSRLLREISDGIGTQDLTKSKEILEYYLLKHLDLVRLEGGFGINLSEKAVEIVKSDPELWNAYTTKPRELPKPVPQEENKPLEVEEVQPFKKRLIKKEALNH